jgi:hypothetical protein
LDKIFHALFFDIFYKIESCVNSIIKTDIGFVKSINFAISGLIYIAVLVVLSRSIRDVFIFLYGTFIGSSKTAVWIINIATFPGVIWHEISHATMAILTGGRVYEINFYGPSGSSLGYVKWAARGSEIKMSIQRFLVGTSPIYFSVIGLKLLETFAMPHLAITGLNLETLGWFIVRYLELSLLLHCGPSNSDLGGNWYASVPIIALVIILVHFILSIGLKN